MPGQIINRGKGEWRGRFVNREFRLRNGFVCKHRANMTAR